VDVLYQAPWLSEVLFLWVENIMKRIHQWLKRKASAAAPLIAYGAAGRPVWTPRNYQTLAEEGYHKNVTVYRCVSLIARGVSSVPWLLYRDEQELEDHPLLTLLNCPSPQQAGSAFMEAVVGYFLLSGNSYIEAILGHQGYPVELYPLRPDRVKIIPGNSGLPIAFDYQLGGHHKRITCDLENGESPILHLKNFNPLNDWYGMSPIEAAARAIDQHNAVGEHNLALLQNGGRPSGALTLKPIPHSQPLTEVQRESLRQDLKAAYEGSSNAGRIMILEGDFEWKEMGLSPKDLDFLPGKLLSAREISQAFGVPPMLAGIPGDATFANYKEARFHLWEDTIIPLLEFILAEFNLWLTPLFGPDLKLTYDSDAIPALVLRREAKWAKIAAADFLTINEKRQAIGYSPLSGGDVLAVKE
jgi:HK97 family phage portal protein